MHPLPHLQSYPFACAVVHQLFPLEEWRQLDLVHCWYNSCVFKKLMKMPDSKVADSNASAKALQLHTVSRKKVTQSIGRRADPEFWSSATEAKPACVQPPVLAMFPFYPGAAQDGA